MPTYKTSPHKVEAFQHNAKDPEETLSFIHKNAGGPMGSDELTILPSGGIMCKSHRSVLLDTDWVVVYYAGMGSVDFKFMQDFYFRQTYFLDESTT